MKHHTTRNVDLDKVKPHPKNYREHPEDQIEHIKRSIEEHGFYRNIVLARDGTILAGHGVVEAARALDYETIPAIVLDIEPDSPQAIKVLVSDNTLSVLAEENDRELGELLKEIQESDDLLGTGFDDQRLAALLTISAPPEQLKNTKPNDWEGMPEYEGKPDRLTLVINFETEEKREEFVAEHDLMIRRKLGPAWTTWWPPKTEPDDVKSLIFE